jgi:hypothetical protein
MTISVSMHGAGTFSMSGQVIELFLSNFLAFSNSSLSTCGPLVINISYTGYVIINRSFVLNCIQASMIGYVI